MVETELIVKITGAGTRQTIGDINNLQKSLASVAKAAKDTAATAAALGKAFDLPDDQVAALADALAQARREATGATAALATAAKQFGLIGTETATAAGQVAQLSGEVAKARDRLKDSFRLRFDLDDQAASGLIDDFQRLQREGADLNTIFKTLGDSYGVTAGQVAKVAASFGDLNQALAAQGAAEQQLSDLQSGVTELASDIEALQRISESSGLEFEGARRFAQELGLTSQQADLVIQRFRELRGVSPEAQFQVLSRELGVTEQQFKQLQRQIRETTDSSKGLSPVLQGIFQGIGQQATQVAIDGVRALGRAIVDTTQKSLDAAGAFDAAAAAVNTLGVDSDALISELQQVGNGLGGQANQIELLKGSYDIASAGFVDAADAAKIVEASVLGATGGFSDFATVSDAVTSALNAYGESADQAESFVDKFIETQNAGKITVGQYAEQIGRLAPTAALAGVGIDELNGFIATATARGVPAESTFAGLRQAISSTLKPTAEAAALSKELGIQFDAAALRSGGLAGILGELNARGLDTADNLSVLFGSVEAVAAIAPSVGEGFSALTTNIDRSANSAGAARKAFDEISATIPGLSTALNNQLTDGFLALGQAIAPIQAGLLEFAGDLLRVTTEGSGGLDGLTAAATRFQTVLTGNPEIVERLGAALATVAESAVRQLELLIDSFTVLVGEQENIELIAGEIENLSAVITVLGQTARFLVVLGQQFNSLRDTLDRFPLMGQVLGFNPSLPIDALRGVQAALEAVRNVVGNVSEFVANLVNRFDLLGSNPVIQALVSQILDVEAATSGLGSTIGGGLTTAIDGLGTAGEAVAGTLAATEGAIAGVGDGVEGEVEKIEDALKRLGSANQDTLSDLSTTAANARAAILESGGDPGQLAAAEAKALKARIAANKAALAELQALQSGNLGAEDAAAVADEIRAIDGALASDRVALAQQTLAEKKRAEDEATRAAEQAEKDRVQAITDGAALQIGALKIVGEQRAAIFAAEAQAAQDQLSILSEDQGLAAASLELERERLETALAQAEAAGNTAEVERLRGEIIAQNAVATAQEFEFKRQQLVLENAIAQAEAQRAIVLSDIALKEAEINLTKAQGIGATEAEIANLRAIIDLRKQDAAAARTAAGVTNEIQGLKSERLDVDEDIAAENQKQAEAQKEVNKATEAGTDAAEGEASAKQKTADLTQQIAEAEERRAAALIGSLRTQQQETAESLKQLAAIRERFREAQQAGLFQEQGAEFNAAAQQLERILGSGGSLKALIQFAQNTESDIARQLLEGVGRGDVLQLIEADEQLKAPLEEGAVTAGQTLEESLVRGAERGAALLAGAIGGGGSRQSLRSGGVAEGGMVQVHKDEFLLPPRGTRVVSQRESRALVREALSARDVGAMMVAPGRGRLSVPTAGGQGEVVAKLDQVLKAIKARPAIRPQATYNLQTVTPQADAVAMQMAELRAIVLGGGL